MAPLIERPVLGELTCENDSNHNCRHWEERRKRKAVMMMKASTITQNKQHSRVIRKARSDTVVDDDEVLRASETILRKLRKETEHRLELQERLMEEQIMNELLRIKIADATRACHEATKKWLSHNHEDDDESTSLSTEEVNKQVTLRSTEWRELQYKYKQGLHDYATLANVVKHMRKQGYTERRVSPSQNQDKALKKRMGLLERTIADQELMIERLQNMCQTLQDALLKSDQRTKGHELLTSTMTHQQVHAAANELVEFEVAIDELTRELD